MSKKHKKIYADLNYFEDFLILNSEVTRNFSISAFASLIGIPIGIKSSAAALKFLQ